MSTTIGRYLVLADNNFVPILRNSGVAVTTHLNTKLFSHQQQSDSGGWHASKSNQIELFNLNNFLNFV